MVVWPNECGDGRPGEACVRRRHAAIGGPDASSRRRSGARAGSLGLGSEARLAPASRRLAAAMRSPRPRPSRVAAASRLQRVRLRLAAAAAATWAARRSSASPAARPPCECRGGVDGSTSPPPHRHPPRLHVPRRRGDVLVAGQHGVSLPPIRAHRFSACQMPSQSRVSRRAPGVTCVPRTCGYRPSTALRRSTSARSRRAA